MTDNAEIREALANLPRADHHPPGQPVELAEFYTVQAHRMALDLKRHLVVANRGMGKSFWAHALLNPEIRSRVATMFGVYWLQNTEVVFGFNGSSRMDAIAPTAEVLAAADRGAPTLVLWQAVLARAVANLVSTELPERFDEVVSWVQADAERCSRLFTAADNALKAQGRHLLLLFDALDRLASDWPTMRRRLQGLLQLALATDSFLALHIKVFLRIDQFKDLSLFEFPDGSKLQSMSVDLSWVPKDLYHLLFHRLRPCQAFRKLELGPDGARRSIKGVVEWLAGQFMGTNKKRGVVVTWLPTHLADASDQISPRTFLTAWREAALHGNCPPVTAVDHQGLLEGVRKASADRLTELSQDYPWVRAALSPLRGQTVPIAQDALIQLWQQSNTVEQVFRRAEESARDILVPLLPGTYPMEELGLLDALKFIGVVNVRRSGKVDVPDIFRLEARIKRRGGVKPPRRQGPESGG